MLLLRWHYINFARQMLNIKNCNRTILTIQPMAKKLNQPQHLTKDELIQKMKELDMKI